MICLRLFWEYFKTGLFSVGGGLATLPFLYEMGEKTGWFTAAEVADMLAVSESTPGPIGVNMATYVGFKTCGVPGAVAATLGLVTPSVIVILLIAAVLRKFKENEYVTGAFYGLRPASAALIASAGFSVMLLVLFNTAGTSVRDFFRFPALILAAFLWFATNRIKAVKKLHPIVTIAFAAVVGAVLRLGGA